MLFCCKSESALNCTCLIILSNIAVYNCDIYVHVSLITEINVGVCLEIAVPKFFNNGYGKEISALQTL